MDGHWEYKNSQLQQHAFSASQSIACVVQVRVMRDTSSGKHKVKVGSITPLPTALKIFVLI